MSARNSFLGAAGPRSACSGRLAARRGFTLVELLMVILIIGLLMGLLFPAINAAREGGRRTQCLNKLKEIASAIQIFETDEARFPGWVEYPFQMTDISVNPPQAYVTSVNYFVPLLPALGRDDIFSPGAGAIGPWKTPVFTGGVPTGVAQPVLRRIAVCPSDAEKMSSQEPELSYVCNSGRHDVPNNQFPYDWKANGIFMDLRPQPGVSQSVNASYVRSNDGMDTTLLLSESLNAGWWSNILDEDGTTFHFFPPDPGTGGPPAPDHGINKGDEYPSSNHPGGVVVVFAGQNARFITNEVDFSVWVALHTPNGEHAKEPGTNAASNSYVTGQPKLTEENIAP
jgi:prepilin-type N-terminal cleavage/methylation domain-containing protein